LTAVLRYPRFLLPLLLIGTLAAPFDVAYAADEEVLEELTLDETEEATKRPARKRTVRDRSRAKSAENAVNIAELEKELALLERKINVTKQQIAKIRDASYLPDLYFSLADMHVQKSRILYILKVEKNKDKNPDSLDFTAEKRPKIEAIEIYQKIYSFFPKDKRRDKALFLQGIEQRDIGQFEQMVRTFNQLSEEFPSSEHFNEANIILADYFFEVKKDVDMTLETLQKVVSRPLSPFTPLAYYRMGWCYMNQMKPDEAVKAFEAAIDTQEQVNPDALPEIYRRTDIRREAVLALVVPYIDLFTDPEKKWGELEHPVIYFQKKSPDHFTYRRALSRAGRRLIIKERWKEAADTFFHVIVLSTDFDTRFEALQRVNEAHKRKESRVDFLPFIKEIGITIDLLQASLPKPIVFNADALLLLQKKAPPVSGKSRRRGKKPDPKEFEQQKIAINQLKFLELLMRDFATQLHKKARSTGSPEDFAQTATAYDIYLERFPKAPKALDIHYNLAEALFKGDRLVRAGMQYEFLSREKRLRKRASMFQESAIESYTKALQNIEVLSPIEKIRARKGLRTVGAQWLKANSRAPGAATVAFNIANSWYEERNLRVAISHFQNFIRRYPRDPHVRDAVFMIINAYSQLDDYKGLQKAGEQMIRIQGLSADDRQAIREAVRRAQTKQFQAMAGDFGTKEYAENLLSVASKYKGSALGQQALFEAFNSLKAKQDPELFDVGEAFLDQHPDSDYAKEVASSMATLAINTASFDRAARYLARFADKYPQEKESLEFRRTAAMLFERQGDFKRARTQYMKLGDKPSIARMDLAVNDWPRLEVSSRESGLPESRYWYAIALWRQRKYQEAIPILKELAENKSVPVDQSGHAKFLLAQLALERFRSIEMKSAEDQQALMEKVKAFQALSAELQSLIKSGAGRWAIAGLYALGQAYYDLGRFIADSPIPPGLSDQDKATYIAELNKQASTYIVEAEKVFATCIEAAETNDVFTHYVDGCRAKGRKVVREEDDLARPQAKAAGAEPPRARAIRKRLLADSKNIDLLYELAQTYVQADQPQTAAGIFARILELEPGSSRARASIGVCALYLNDFDAAYDSFKKALEMNDTDPTALWGLAGLYKHFGFKLKFQQIRARTKTIKPPELMHPWSKGI